MVLIQHVKAPQDVHGNPRRLYLVTEVTPDENGYPREVRTVAYDEGYRGMNAIPGRTGEEYLLPAVNATPTEYRRLIKQYPR